MKKFEYLTFDLQLLVNPTYQGLDKRKLNELGLDGWELVTVISGECVFKRELKD